MTSRRDRNLEWELDLDNYLQMAQLFSLVKYDDLLRYMGNSMGQWDGGYPLVISYIVNPIWGVPQS